MGFSSESKTACIVACGATAKVRDTLCMVEARASPGTTGQPNHHRHSSEGWNPGRDGMRSICKEIQYNFDSKSAIFAASKNQAAARELLAFFACRENAAKFTAAGLEQLRMGG
jgi:hypothetical protein